MQIYTQETIRLFQFNICLNLRVRVSTLFWILEIQVSPCFNEKLKNKIIQFRTNCSKRATPKNGQISLLLQKMIFSKQATLRSHCSTIILLFVNNLLGLVGIFTIYHEALHIHQGLKGLMNVTFVKPLLFLVKITLVST